MSSPLAGVQLHLVKSIDDLLDCREWAGQQRDTPMAFDTESEGLVPQRDRLRMVQLGDKFHGWAFPFEWSGAAIELINALVQNRSPLVAHNSGFDHRFISKWLGYQIPWHLIHDTMTIAALADPTRPKGLKPLAQRLIDKNATAGQHLLDDGMKKNGWTWATVPADFPPYWCYAALDPVLTAWIWDMLSPDVLRTAPEAYDLERSVTPLLCSMMDSGLMIDRDYTVRKIDELQKYARAARTWLKDTHSVDSIMSAKQIHAALAAVDLLITGVTKTGLPSITKEVLIGIANAPEGEVSQAARDLTSTVLRVRHAEKICGTYLENFLSLSAGDDIIRCSIRQLEARTGRMSISDPSLQNLPRDDKVVRGCFIPRPGNALISIDASQIELRIAAHLCQDDGLIAAIREADATGADIYCGIASMLFGETITKKDTRRQFTKNAGYCKIYGGGVRKIATTIGLPFEQARQMNDLYDQRFPKLASHAGELIATARQQIANGERPHTRTDTGRYLPCDDDKAYALMNYVTQSTAAEELKRGITRLASAGFSDMLRLPVHDEVILECPADDADEVLKSAQEVLREDHRYLVSIPWEGAVMRERWVKS